MRLLLDTCTFLWLVLDDPVIPAGVWELVRNPNNDLYLSVVAGWEMAIKYKAGKLALPEAPSVFVPEYRKKNNVLSLPLNEESVLQVSKLPEFHSDPFDRMMVCQAIMHSLAIVTPDDMIRQYPVRTIW